MDGNNIRPPIIDLHDDELGKISCLYANVALMLSKWHQHGFKFLGLYQSLYYEATRRNLSRIDYYNFISVFKQCCVEKTHNRKQLLFSQKSPKRLIILRLR